MAETRARANQKEATSKTNEDALDLRFAAWEERVTNRLEDMLEAFQASQQRATETAMGYDETARKKTHNNLYGGMTKIDIILPRFDGSKVKDWLSKVDGFLAVVNTPIEMMVTICGKHFDGDAAKWHQTMMQSPYGKNLLNDWGFYKQLLKERFTDTGDDPIAELKTLQETEDIVEYHKKFEKIRMRVHLPEEYLVSVYLTGLRLDTQMYVRRFQPHCIRRCFELGQLYEMAYPIKGTGSVKNFPESQKWSKPEKSKGIENKSEVEEVLIVQGDITVESDSVSEQIKDVSIPFSGEERVCAAESSIQVVDETYAVPEINPREPLLLDNSQETKSKCIMKPEMVEMLVQENGSYEVDESVMETYCDQQFQVKAYQMFDKMAMREQQLQQLRKWSKPLKSWKFRFKIVHRFCSSKKGDALEEGLLIVGVEKLSIEEMQKSEWSSMDESSSLNQSLVHYNLPFREISAVSTRKFQLQDRFSEKGMARELMKTDFVEAHEALVEMTIWVLRLLAILQAAECVSEMLSGKYYQFVGCYNEVGFHGIDAIKETENNSMQATCQAFAAVSYPSLTDVEVIMHHKGEPIHELNEWRIMLLKKERRGKDWRFKYRHMEVDLLLQQTTLLDLQRRFPYLKP